MERAVSDVTCGVMREARSAAQPAARTSETSLQCGALNAIAIAVEQAGADPSNAGVRRSPQRAPGPRVHADFVNESGHLYGSSHVAERRSPAEWPILLFARVNWSSTSYLRLSGSSRAQVSDCQAEPGFRPVKTC
ncbi:hypothetical protein [Sorangium sp. So ce1099]|uniref:hypothetical protein n=1 Tax=Sorangium sp. So ce1099 TaxID=3133331 RepID=UPI003F6371A5